MRLSFLIAAGIAVALFMSGGAKGIGTQAEGIMSGPCIGCAEGIINVGAAGPACLAPTVAAVSPNNGSSAGGTSVTLTGANLTGATVTNFGVSNPASFVVVNPTTILVASSPAGSVGTVDVTVTTACGTSAISAADHYTYNSSYVGPIDINGPALGCYSLRACSAAYATGTNPDVDLVDQAGANPVTINILASGSLDVATIATWVTAHSVTTIKVTKVYDQSGNSRHLPQITLSQMPALLLAQTVGTKSLPIITCNGAASQFLGPSPALTQAQPLTMVAVAQRTTVSSNGRIFASISGPELLASTTGLWGLFAGGGIVSTAASENAYHVYDGYFLNGATSFGSIDGAAGSTGNPGTTGISADTLNICGLGSGGSYFTGVFLESVAWAASKAANDATYFANVSAYYGGI